MKTTASCVLSIVLSMAAYGGITDALGASAPPPNHYARHADGQFTERIALCVTASTASRSSS